uniref:Uncharacterized protein n=1 Tax=Chromera velia CCMP2878 TaxID=1169474 RepID=A0A0G4GU05_9ALVE|eukprot:Cvel_5203.t1-p1 / transcript=Cvel_5203.t1 / gene=Cvel_5203 / organism=Chromera_velia_CCMP2878 / gene_product=hypothetical protein / transcript_product=hypothetical protein / location=Cvel_scaffold239:61435-61911(+) / protein_length=159 / sequence_SO=supercontig / SO=protein_coding / is_pseudo=false
MYLIVTCFEQCLFVAFILVLRLCSLLSDHMIKVLWALPTSVFAVSATTQAEVLAVFFELPDEMFVVTLYLHGLFNAWLNVECFKLDATWNGIFGGVRACRPHERVSVGGPWASLLLMLWLLAAAVGTAVRVYGDVGVSVRLPLTILTVVFVLLAIVPSV